MAKTEMTDSELEENVNVDGTPTPPADGPKTSEETVEKNGENKVDGASAIITPPSRISTNISILIESLVQNIVTIYETDAKKAAMIYKLICNKLFSMNMIDESYDMIEFEGIRHQYQRAFSTILASALGNGAEAALPLRPLWPNTDTTNSHYLREFDEIEYIAGGGFGQVYKVRHKLDGVEYAVKKIPIRSEGINSVRNYLSEVKTFSSINHTNIVQYKAAWLEIGSTSSNKAITERSHNEFSSTSSLSITPNTEEDHVDEYIYHKSSEHSFSEVGVEEEDSDFEVTFERSSINNNTVNKTDYLHSTVRKFKKERKESVSEGEHVVCTLDLKEIKRIRSSQRTEAKWATLYIQMSLCQTTLKQWLEKRNKMETPTNSDVALMPVSGQIFRNNTVFEILAQLLKGLDYIHSKGIVHHDIKPSNIFIQLENGIVLVQLGDFGLACPLQSVRHSLAFGTKLYAAPEQLAGKCDKKSDMYSLGIVLFELVENFCTDMERVQHISELRKGILPQHILAEQPQVAEMIKHLTLRNPADRPDASSLLNTIELKSNEVEEIKQLKLQLAEKDEEIMHLKELLKCHGIGSV